EAVGDVGSAAAGYAPHLVHQEGDRQPRQAVRDQVLDEPPGEPHEVVERHGSGDNHLTLGAGRRQAEGGRRIDAGRLRHAYRLPPAVCRLPPLTGTVRRWDGGAPWPPPEWLPGRSGSR